MEEKKGKQRKSLLDVCRLTALSKPPSVEIKLSLFHHGNRGIVRSDLNTAYNSFPSIRPAGRLFLDTYISPWPR